MFKLESYLTPWLLGYLDKYVKLKPEDFQLSLWGGDAVFNNLDLRLNVIESLTNIPITFKSGVINELRIHIPWTRITSEPVVVTINTLEFVAKLKDVNQSGTKTPQQTPDSSINLNKSDPVESQVNSQQNVQQLPSGYIQNIISKILFNICIIINNIIVKFVEDDIVLSFNMKSAEFFSVNELWEKTFVDINTQNIDLKKILQLNDVTICLDRLDNKKSNQSKITNYQDPLIYRCSIESRLDFKYKNNVNNLIDQELKLMKLNFYCRKFDVSITDQQLPMLLRLAELVDAILNENLNLSEQEEQTKENNKQEIQTNNFITSINENMIRGNQLVEELRKKETENVDAMSEDNKGWLSWAWSYVPSVSNLVLINEELNETQPSLKNDFQMLIGVYFDEFNLTFKLTQKQSLFEAFLTCKTKGICLEINKKENYLNLLFGVSYLCLSSVGECCCKLCPKPCLNESQILLAGSLDIEEKTFHYLTDSLFDIQDESETDKDSYESKSRDKSGNLDESYGQKRFGAIFMDYLDSMLVQNENENSQEESEVNNSSSIYLILYSIKLNISANLLHRLIKIYDCSQSNSYSNPYSLPSVKNELISNESTDLNIEKKLPKFNFNLILKEPEITFLPYTHFLIAQIATQDLNLDFMFILSFKYFYFNQTKPLNEKVVFNLVTNTPNPSKKLIYDSYVHSQIICDGFKLTYLLQNIKSGFKLESNLVEPCYLELNLSNVIMSPEAWNKQYFALNEFSIELPILKLNLNKQILFILNDYADNYLTPVLNESIFNQIKHPFINKSQMKKAKLRQMIYKRLLEDLIQNNKQYLTVCLNDFKLKYSLTKIMQIVQLNINLISLYLNTNELIPLIESSNKPSGKMIKDFLVLRAQLPLSIDSQNSYIPDPIFIYINMNELSLNIQTELLNSLNYKPFLTKNDNDLLNLLVLDLFEDVDDPDLNDDSNLVNKLRLNQHKDKYSVKKKLDHVETCSTSSKKSSSIRQIKLKSNFKIKEERPQLSHKTNATQDQKATLIDTLYDLLKTLHIQVSIKPIRLSFNKAIKLNLPQIDLKSSGTKCDLEEELINSKLIELPCTYLRACEKTSNKIPWLIDLKSFEFFIDSAENKIYLINPIDFTAHFLVKPKYHQYDNLLSSLSIVLNIEFSKKIDFILNLDYFDMMLDFLSQSLNTAENFEIKFDYMGLENTSMFEEKNSECFNEWDESRSYSTVSILKEYDLNSIEDEDDFEMSKLNSEDLNDHCSLSTGDLSSSSSCVSNIELKKNKKKFIKPQKVVSDNQKLNRMMTNIVERENNHDHIKLNLSLNMFIFSFNFNLIDKKDSISFNMNRILFESDLNNIYQRYGLKIKKFDLLSHDCVLLQSDFENTSENFLDLILTNALVSNLNKKLNNQKDSDQKKKTLRSLNKYCSSSSSQKYIQEINLQINNFNFYFNMNKFKPIIQFNQHLNTFISSKSALNARKEVLIPLIRSRDVPLMNIELKKGCFVFPIASETISFEFKSGTLTSQVENPIIRNFMHSTTSSNIYNRAKSNGLLYRPGFVFEDRQYLVQFKQISLKTNKNEIIDDFNLKFVLGLPILFEKRLINGYALELHVLNLNLNIHDYDLNLIYDFIEYNSTFFEANNNNLNQSNSKSDQSDLELVPVDTLVTFETINMNLYKNNSDILQAQFIQPHLCFYMHENSQKFEISIFDLIIKRNLNSPILETKPGEPNPKTGILSGVFLFRVENFINLFNNNNKESLKINESNKAKICVCNNCLKCYEIDLNSNRLESIRTSLWFERPIKAKFSLSLYQDIIDFVNRIKFFTSNTQESNNDNSLIYFFNLNLSLKTSQILFVIETDLDQNLNLSLSSLCLVLRNKCKLDFNLNDLSANLSNKQEFMVNFLGPVTTKLNLFYDQTENEVYAFADFGSFSVNFNHFILNFILNLKNIYENCSKTEKLVDNVTQTEETIHLIKYEDDLRNGSFKFKIVDDGFLKKLTLEDSLCHVILPEPNEIVCVDDLSSKEMITSSVCWRYPKKRALSSLKILPLPFIGNFSKSEPLKLYLEFYNECLSKFEVLKEFWIEEGIRIDVLEATNEADSVYSKIWRIRLSDEAKRYLYASSLLASTQINSIESTRTQKNINFNLELNLNNLELKLNSIRKNFSQADLALICLNDLRSKISLNNNFITINLYSQLNVDYCEYQFLTYRSLIDLFQFKMNLTMDQNKLDMSLFLDYLSLQMSQTGLLALKNLENEFQPSQTAEANPHYYLILNDTNLDLNIKQFDTEETCLLKPGTYQPYIWRTHKKSQLLQIFIPKYKQSTKPFQINENSRFELTIQLSDTLKFDLIITVETKFEPTRSSFEHKKFGSFKKFIFIQTKFFICNYLSWDMDSFEMFYNHGELKLEEKVTKFTRSNTSLCLIQSIFEPIELKWIKINKKLVPVSIELLKEGLLWEDDELNLKFWLSLDQNFSFCIILTPLFVLCSYLPYDLSVKFNKADEFRLKSNSGSYFNEKIDCLNFHNSAIESNYLSHMFEENDWYELKINLLTSLNSIPYLTNSFQDKKLSHINLFKFKSLYNKSVLDLNIQINEKNEEKIINNGFNKPDMLMKNEIKFLTSNFMVHKSYCWNFSPTIRLDIKPECLVVNKTNYLLKIHEKSDISNEISSYDLDQNGGHLCLSELSGKSKKFKISITLEEYSLNRNENLNIDLDKNVVDYESDWIEIKDEPVSPFYRERFSGHKMNCLYTNKCWIDLKLFPNKANSRLKLIYLILTNDDRNCLNKNLSEIDTQGLQIEELNKLYEAPSYRFLSIQPKFIIKNKTNLDLSLKLFNSHSIVRENLLEKFVQTEDGLIKSMSDLKTGSVLDHSNYFLKTNNQNLNEYELEKEKLSDLYFIKLDNYVQSKPLVLTVKEKALKQINPDENLLISKQSFCVYDSKKNTTSLTLTQKLLVTKTGQLLIILKLDKNILVNLYNNLDFDLLVWPRLSTNFIFENYIRNSNMITEKLLNEKFKKKMNQNDMNSFKHSSLIYMHLLPAKTWFKFNYDFIGTNYFPIENLNEQIFFMFALLNTSDFDLSPNLCKIYDQNIEIGFENNKNVKFFYLSNTSNTDRYLSFSQEAIVSNASNITDFNFRLNLNIERISLALNDDFLSELNQTEILRLTLDQCYFTMNNLNFNFSLTHLQLDNQMFDLNSNNLSLKYDFPMVFIPRETNKQKQNLIKNEFYKNLNSFNHKLEDQSEMFVNVSVKLNENLVLNELDILIKPFDLYLEDYLIFNLSKLGLEFIDFISNQDLDERNQDEFLNDESDLDLITKPILRIKKLSINKIDALVSLQTSIKLYLATYKMPILFEEFKINGLPVSILSSPQLVKLITSHYLTSLLFRAGWLLGSLDLIGSPTAFIQQVSNGVFDFLKLPYRGLRSSGPTGLIQGLSSGSVSLIRNLSSGTITSLTSFASFVSRNMDILSFDPHHLARQEQFRHQQSDSISSGLLQVSSSFIISIMGAIGGLAEQPIQSVVQSDSILKGVSKGLIGLVTKPVGAVAELVNQTGHGLLKLTGVNRLPLNELRLQKKALNKQYSRYQISSTKCLWKLLNSFGNKIHINSMIEAVFTNDIIKNRKSLSNGDNLAECYLVLSDDILYIIDKNEDMLSRAFFISQINLKIVKEELFNETVLCLSLNNQKIELFLNEYQKIYENTIDRLVDFVLQSSFNEKSVLELSSLSKDESVFLYNQDYFKCECGFEIKRLNENRKDLLSPKPILGKEKSVSDVFFCNDSHVVLKNEIPRIHRIQSNQSQASKSSLEQKLEEKQDLEKKFYYYIDPRVSDNFINIFNSLKRKSSNKGFQF